MTIKERILFYLKENSILREDFYKETGLSASNFKGVALSSELGGEKIVKILTTYKTISPDWLLTGEGSMLRSEATPPSASLPAINQEYQGAPYYNVDFIGGFELVGNDQTQNPDYYINYPPYNKEGVLWCNLTGHSMEPEISNGDVIALKAMTSPIEYLPTGEIYAIVTDDYRTVKRISQGDRPGFIRLIPSNPSREFREQEIPIEMIRKIYAVLGSIRKFF